MKRKTKKSVFYLLVVMVLISVFGYISKQNEAINIISPLPIKTPQAQASFIKIPTTEYSQEDIENYLRYMFGSEGKTAVAIQWDECDPAREDYPYCINHSDIEYSCGLMQINLYVHSGKVPGENLEEKCEWLLNPYQNILIAYKIQKESGWWPWTTYQTGQYKENL